MDRTRIKAIHLFEEGKVVKEVENDKRIHFRVIGDTAIHSVILDKEKNEWSCDCKFSTLKKKECSHVIASKLLENNLQ